MLDLVYMYVLCTVHYVSLNTWGSLQDNNNSQEQSRHRDRGMDAQSLPMTLAGGGGGVLISLNSRLSPLPSSSTRLSSFAVPLRKPKFPLAIRGKIHPTYRYFLLDLFSFHSLYFLPLSLCLSLSSIINTSKEDMYYIPCG